MRSRNPLQANDLLDIVDFIKNEEKYSVRIKELQDLEASLNTKLQIVNTLDGANVLIAKHKATQGALDKERLEIQVTAKELAAKREAEHIFKMDEVQKKQTEARTFQKSVAKELEEARRIKQENSIERTLLDTTAKELAARERQLVLAESHWKQKLAALQQLMNGG